MSADILTWADMWVIPAGTHTMVRLHAASIYWLLWWRTNGA